jgi:hypothetical protein
VSTGRGSQRIHIPRLAHARRTHIHIFRSPIDDCTSILYNYIPLELAMRVRQGLTYSSGCRTGSSGGLSGRARVAIGTVPR